MKRTVVSVSLLVVAALLWGCGQDTGTAQAPEAAPAVPQGSAPADKPVTERVRSAVESAVNTAEERMSEAAASASDTAQPAVTKAKELLDQAMTYVQENNLDLAQGALDSLTDLKDALPESLQQQIDKLQALLQTKQSAQAASPMDAAKGMLPGQGQ